MASEFLHFENIAWPPLQQAERAASGGYPVLFKLGFYVAAAMATGDYVKWFFRTPPLESFVFDRLEVAITPNTREFSDLELYRSCPRWELPNTGVNANHWNAVGSAIPCRIGWESPVVYTGDTRKPASDNWWEQPRIIGPANEWTFEVAAGAGVPSGWVIGDTIDVSMFVYRYPELENIELLAGDRDRLMVPYPGIALSPNQQP